MRTYQPYRDALKVRAFFSRTYPSTDRNPNWLRARWKYVLYSPTGLSLGLLAVQEAGASLVLVCRLRVAIEPLDDAVDTIDAVGRLSAA